MKKIKLILRLLCLFISKISLAQDATSIRLSIDTPVHGEQYALGLNMIKASAISNIDTPLYISHSAEWGFYIKIKNLDKVQIITNGECGAGAYHNGRLFNSHDTVSYNIHLNLFELMGLIYERDSTIITKRVEDIKIQLGIAAWYKWTSYRSQEFTINIQPLSQEDISAFFFLKNRGLNPFAYPSRCFLLSNWKDDTNLTLISQHPQSTFTLLAKVSLAHQKAFEANWKPDAAAKQQIMQWLEQPLISSFTYVKYLAEEIRDKIQH